MARIRQLYLYGVSAVSLLFLATGLENLIRLAIQTLGGREATAWLWLNQGNLRQQVSFFVALTIISGPVWVGHWLLANREHTRAGAASAIRRFYLYLVMAGALLFFIPGAISLIRLPLWALLGAAVREPYLSALGAPIGLALVTVPIWRYHWHVAQAEAAATGEAGALGTVRRLYFYPAAFGTMIFLLLGYARLATSVWEGVLHPDVLRSTSGWAWASLAFPAYGATIAVFLALWWWHWAQSEEIARAPGPVGLDERQSLLRRLALAGLVLVGSVVGVVNVATLLNDLLRALLGSPDPTGSSRPLLDALGQPLVWGLTFGAAWLYHRRLLQREADRDAESGGRGSLRRFDTYLIAAVGVVVLVLGLVFLLSTLLSWLTPTPPPLARDWYRDRLSAALTLVLIGAPVWLIHWLEQQRQTARPDTSARAERGALAGAAERSSLWRRLYLYTILFATVVAIVIDAARLLYQLLLVALGDKALPELIEPIRTPLSVIVVGAVVLLSHWQVLRADQEATGTAASTTQPAVAAILLRAPTPERLEAWLGQLAELPREGCELTIVREPSLAQRIHERLRQPLATPGPREGGS